MFFHNPQLPAPNKLETKHKIIISVQQFFVDLAILPVLIYGPSNFEKGDTQGPSHCIFVAISGSRVIKRRYVQLDFLQ